MNIVIVYNIHRTLPCRFATPTFLSSPCLLFLRGFATPTLPSSLSLLCPRHFVVSLVSSSPSFRDLSSLSLSHSHFLSFLYTPVIILINTHNPSYAQWLVDLGVLVVVVEVVTDH